MRTRLTLLLVAIVALACFATLNWSEFARPVQLSWGFGTGEAPLGLIMLALLAASWIAFLLGSAYLETHYQLASHRNGKALEAQRVLADRAEASRFTELRTYMENQTAQAAQREAAAIARLEHVMHAELNGLLAAMDRLSARALPYPPEALRSGGTLRNDPVGGHTPH